MSNINLIALSGQLQNGKDTVAEMILNITGFYYPFKEEVYSNWQIRKFAGALKQIIAILIGCNIKDLEKEEFKNKPLGEEWKRWFFNNEFLNKRVSPIFSSYKDAIEYRDKLGLGSTFELKEEILTPRMILQTLGTEAARELIHPNIWINSTLGNLKEDDKIVISDCRFLNEMLEIKKRNGILVKITRPSVVSSSNHLSETSINEFNYWDYHIENNGTLKDLEKKVEDMLNYFEILQ